MFPPHRASASGTVEVWAALSSTSGCIAVVTPMSEEGVAGHVRPRADHHASGRGRGDNRVEPLCDVVTTVSNATHKVMSTTPLATTAPITPWGRVRHAAIVTVSGWHGAVNISVDVVNRADVSRAVVSQVWPYEVRPHPIETCMLCLTSAHCRLLATHLAVLCCRCCLLASPAVLCCHIRLQSLSPTVFCRRICLMEASLAMLCCLCAVCCMASTREHARWVYDILT